MNDQVIIVGAVAAR